MSGIWLMLAAFTISIFLLVVYFSKKNVSNKETKLYSAMLIFNFLYSLLAIIGYIYAKNGGVEFVVAIIQKIHLSITLLFSYFFVRYNITLIEKNNDFFHILHKVYLSAVALVILAIFLVPIEVINEGEILDTAGPSYYVAIIGVVVNMIIITITTLVITIKYRDNRKKFIPLVVLIVLLCLALFLRASFPETITETYSVCFALLVMFFTIENPDAKMVNQLEIAKDSAEKANHAKSDFLSSMSHDIRTPLNAIVGLSEDILNYKESLPKEVLEDAGDIINASNTLLEIVGNILDINKIESNKMEIVERTYDIRKEVNEIVSVATTRIEDKPIDFNLDIAVDVPRELIGDKAHIKTIINNLLTNAIKYTDKGKVSLSIKCINNKDICTLIISVMDTGKGIKKENINKIFTEVERDTTLEGTGLGLAITKRLVELMNGKINVQSTYKKGSIFVVQLPQRIGKREDLTATQVLSKKLIVEKMHKEHAGKKVLIVDDNKLNIKVAKKNMAAYGFLIDEVMSGQECLDKIGAGSKYDLILMDIKMPEMSGLTTLKKLKEDESFNTPVIALTADALADSEAKYNKEGFVSYLSKPFTQEQLAEKLDSIFLKDK